MSLPPFKRTRIADGITRSIAPLLRTCAGARAGLAFGFMLTAALLITITACTSSRPISPSRGSANALTNDHDFNARELEGLDRLRSILAVPRSNAPEGGLLVRLAFGEAADLDLFVTDPLQESVYFANSPTRSGGSLLDDRRCGDPSPRVETVHYPHPMPGRYRVGVDFHRRCDETSISGGEEKHGFYIVRIDDGERVLERAGMATPGHFEVIVIEFEIRP